MDAHDQGAAPVLQAVHDVDFPKRLAAVQHLAEQTRGQRLQFGFPAGRFQTYAEDVALDVEVRVVLPGGVTEVERRRHRNLPVAGNQVQLGIDVGHEFAERDGAIEDPDGSDIQRYLFSFQVKKGRVDSRQTAIEDRRFLVHVVFGSRLRTAITGNWRGWRQCLLRPATLRYR